MINMKFRVSNCKDLIFYRKNLIWLQFDKWDDFQFQTSFNVYYFDALGREQLLGPIKMGFKGMKPGCIIDQIPTDFVQLPNIFFSLGQDELYYLNVSQLGDTTREDILKSLQDVAFNLKHFISHRNEEVMEKSLLRSISAFTVKGQFHRIAKGGARLTKYKFSYCISPDVGSNTNDNPRMDFEVLPNSNPPSNVHVMIGRNGSGKTKMLQSMMNSLITGDSRWIQSDAKAENVNQKKAKFANVICIAFSPFDDFYIDEKKKTSLPWYYIGLNKHSGDLLHDIKEQFYSAFSNCMLIAWKRRLWIESIELLKSDPLFADEGINSFADGMDVIENDDSIKQRKDSILEVFSRLSSGHKLVLLIITGCVDKIEEQSIILFDEPENHLHPPLISALIRALSNLLSDRNGVAIISTHSPVVLQEVPSSCVWVLNRYGQLLKVERPSIQTFGASIGSLTREVFGLEVTKSGFHNLLYEMVKKLEDEREKNPRDKGKLDDYEYVASQFKDQLGNEAETLLRTLIALQKKEVL